MSDTRAIAVWEFGSIAFGINAADAIAKGSPIDSLLTGTTHPGKYVVLVAGDTASVDVARDIVRDLGVESIDHRFLPDPDARVVGAVLTDQDMHFSGEQSDIHIFEMKIREVLADIPQFDERPPVDHSRPSNAAVDV